MSETVAPWGRVHPAVRVVCFLVFGFFLALGGAYQLLIAAILLLILFSLSGCVAFQGCWPMLRRMRWFLLSIMVIYLWMTPGRPIIAMDATAWWMPTIEGLSMGGQRLTALLLMVVAIHWLLWATPRDQLVSAIYWLAAPLTWFGFSRLRLAVRLALVLEIVAGVQTMVAHRVQAVTVNKCDMKGYISAASALVADVVNKGEEAVCHSVEINVDDSPAQLQWLWPLLLVLLMSAPGLMV